MRILVDNPGMFTTIQDLGRPGHGLDGVSRAGAADSQALKIGNQILGNAPNTPGLEMTLLGGTFTFPEGAQIALTGGKPAAHQINKLIELKPGETLRVGGLETGARCYLCVRGGIDVPLVAGSASTHVLSGLGPPPLRKGDELRIGPPQGEPIGEVTPPEYRKQIRVTEGPQADLFDTEIFYQSEYTVTAGSNRMGLRLEGPPLASHDSQMVTEGVPLGAIQIPANGQPIILFVDQQTTGGYPKVANVITADLPSVAQLRPHDRIRFQKTVSKTNLI
ncbi:MAG: biotin-dependent carboxyltransferase family protein [Acidobacteria bacterium]|nr:biotin-dependent carboxyltransferase family protein [Acidobacteriota bacterium]